MSRICQTYWIVCQQVDSTELWQLLKTLWAEKKNLLSPNFKSANTMNFDCIKMCCVRKRNLCIPTNGNCFGFHDNGNVDTALQHKLTRSLSINSLNSMNINQAIQPIRGNNSFITDLLKIHRCWPENGQQETGEFHEKPIHGAFISSRWNDSTEGNETSDWKRIRTKERADKARNGWKHHRKRRLCG